MPAGPEIPEWADPRDLDPAIRAALRGLDPRNSVQVAGHLVVAGSLVDEDPETALAHARAARDRASRLAVVREAVGVAAYHAGDFAEAAREIRAYRRMSGDHGYRAVLADCERALGRPEVALRLVADALAEGVDAEETVELRLVEAGARQDLGEHAAARLTLEAALGGRREPDGLDPADEGQLRLAAAYADLLRAQGEDERADRWFDEVAAVAPELVGEELGVEFAEQGDDEDQPVDLTGDDVAVDPAVDAAVEDELVVDAGAEDDARGVPEAGELAEAASADDADADADVAPVAADVPTPVVGDLSVSFSSFADDVEAEVAELLGEDTEEDGPASAH
ncbi:hypothetical protein [Blastococcus xanthinilyticus]|uniref:hypothetical protein n=1 Tax=Blastococcus xanthinilyticus TaxID=1564164 RepID=UPI0014127E6B|nr:hypothetical protein [Blastococcus xanthinilyticus]